jgi:SAM-dependent methyltransferase
MMAVEREIATAVASARAPADRPHCLNLGCGSRFHPAWVNLDLSPQHASVRRHDVTGPLPFADRTFDAVYHAHLLEHLPRERAAPFLHECFRVLESGGVLRVVVPDLEQIARLYLESLDAAWEGELDARRRHTWAVLEIYDQAVREHPGGEMLAYLAQATAQPADLAWYRVGADGAVIRQHLERVAPASRPGLLRRGRQLLRGGWRERLIRWLLGREYGLLQAARFRQGGEIHRWMYDRQSLRELLTAAGFVAFRLTAAGESGIPGWADDHLDTQPDGAAAKPDSLYAEAVRP